MTDKHPADPYLHDYCEKTDGLSYEPGGHWVGTDGMQLALDAFRAGWDAREKDSKDESAYRAWRDGRRAAEPYFLPPNPLAREAWYAALRYEREDSDKHGR